MFITALVSYSLRKNNYVYMEYCGHTNLKYSQWQKDPSFFYKHGNFLSWQKHKKSKFVIFACDM